MLVCKVAVQLIVNFCTYSLTWRIHGISIGLTLEILSGKVSKHLQALGMGGVSPSDILDLIDGCSGGYGKSIQEELGELSWQLLLSLSGLVPL